jgi:CHAT domain-containing protein/outer membrane murein-binding lipoprotein Lpp/HEPN domain-containing protein
MLSTPCNSGFKRRQFPLGELIVCWVLAGCVAEQPQDMNAASIDDAAARIEQLQSQARAAIREGNFTDAYALTSEAVSIGTDRFDLLDSINTESYLLVSELAGRLDQPAMSIVYAENAFSTVEGSLAPDNPLSATVLRAMGVAYGRAGDFKAAEELIQAASQVHEEALGATAPDVATDLLALAELYLGADNPLALRAVPEILRRAKRIREVNFDEGSVELAEIWLLQGRTIAEMYTPGVEYEGVSAEAVVNAAETALRVAEKIYNAHFECPHPIFAPLYRAWGDLYLKTNRRDLAIDAYVKALDASSSLPNTNDALRVASLAAAQGDAQLTVSACRAANTLALARFDEFAHWADIADMSKYRRHVNPAQQICLSLVYSLDLPDIEKARAMAELAITWRAAASRSARERLNRLREEPAGRLVEDLKDLDSSRRALSDDLIHVLRGGEVGVDRISDRLDEVRHFEEIIALESLPPADKSYVAQPSLQAITERLASDDALLIFQRVDYFDPMAPYSAGTDRYVALIVRPDGTVLLKDYGAVVTFDTAVLKALTELRTAHPLYPPTQLDAASQLYRLIWQPVAEALAPCKRVFMVTDGAMSLVPFAVLRDDTEHFLIEAKELLYLTSPASLLRESGKEAQTGLEALVIAGPDFGPLPSPGHRGAFVFTELGAAASELTLVGDHLDGEISAVVGAQASKKAILESPPARYVHFATHGFFLLDSQIAPLREIDRALIEEGHDSIAREIDLVRSGLALAGANEDLPGEAGILTALEIASLDFTATKLVTLSACETGVGTLETDEGVVGLRQAFELAGAHNLIMSLWKVKGVEGRRQMEALYAYLQAGRSPGEALRQVQIDRIAWYRDKIHDAPPLLWGAFIIQADECPCSDR